MNDTFPAPLQNIYLRGKLGAVSIDGVFVGIDGIIVGSPIFGAGIDETAPSSLADIYGDDIPDGAVGFIFDNTEDTLWGAFSPSPVDATDMDGCPTITSGSSRVLGRVFR